MFGRWPFCFCVRLALAALAVLPRRGIECQSINVEFFGEFVREFRCFAHDPFALESTIKLIPVVTDSYSILGYILAVAGRACEKLVCYTHSPCSASVNSGLCSGSFRFSESFT